MGAGFTIRFIRVVTRFYGLFFQGIVMTLLLATITVLFGTVLGALLAVCKMSRFKPISWLSSSYIEVIRGTPLLLQLYFFYFALTQMITFIKLTKFSATATALALNVAAYMAEIIRSGIQSIDKGQTEAARSLGLTSRQTMMHIVLPQAVKNILPAIVNEFITTIKQTSLASTFFVGDLMTQFNTIRGITYLSFEPLLVVGIIYFVLTTVLSKLAAMYEMRLMASD